MNKWRGESELTVDDSVIRVLALRETALIHALAHRGHAAQTPIALSRAQTSLGAESELTEALINWRSGALPEVLIQARAFPEWSALHSKHVTSLRREAAVEELARLLEGGQETVVVREQMSEPEPVSGSHPPIPNQPPEETLHSESKS